VIGATPTRSSEVSQVQGGYTVARGASGSAEAALLSAAYEANADRIYRRLLGASRDPALAEDLVQEAFTRLVVEVQAGRLPDNIGGWLYRVAMNQFVSRTRHLKVADRYVRQLRPDQAEASPENVLEGRELARGLSALLDGLAPSDRAAILMAAEGCTALEIAERLDRTEPAARTLLCRARSRLRLQLAAAG
jgi:RNA polymerase sigma-70 factor (ECF subfamily)